MSVSLFIICYVIAYRIRYKYVRALISLFFIFILLTRGESIELLIHRVSNYSACFRRYQDIAVRLKFDRDMNEV